MKYSAPYSNVTLSREASRRIRWGTSRFAPYWGSRYGVISNPTGGASYPIVDVPSGVYYWCFGWHMSATVDCRIAVRDSLQSRQYVYEFSSASSRNWTIISPTPLFGHPNRITGTNKIEVWFASSVTGSLYYTLLGIDAYDSDYEDLP